MSFGDLLHNELDAFDDGSEGRITLTGPEVALSSQLAVSLGMALHELTTNAAKYGSLSVYGGKVDVTWSLTIEATRRRLDLRLGGERRTGGDGAQAAGLRFAAAGFRAARTDPGQGQHRMARGRLARALPGAVAAGSKPMDEISKVAGNFPGHFDFEYAAPWLHPLDDALGHFLGVAQAASWCCRGRTAGCRCRHSPTPASA